MDVRNMDVRNTDARVEDAGIKDAGIKDARIGDIRIDRGRALIDDRLEDTTIRVSPAQGGVISQIGGDAPAVRSLDATGLLVLPGIVDIHGDAFERQMMPRPRVD